MKKIIFICLAAVTVYMNTAAQGINFIEGKPFAEVKALAKAEGKLIFVDCYTSWCGPCKMMATKEFVKKEAGDYFNNKFVNYKIRTFPYIYKWIAFYKFLFFFFC